jgi:hypothetical protein
MDDYRADDNFEYFKELTSQIYWEDYAESLAREDRKRLKAEYEEFLNTYGHEMV